MSFKSKQNPERNTKLVINFENVVMFFFDEMIREKEKVGENGNRIGKGRIILNFYMHL